MFKKQFLFTLFTLFYFSVQGQQQVFVGVQSMWGSGLTSIESKGNILKSKSIPWQINTGVSVQYRIANSFSIEGGVSIDNLIWKTYDKDFKGRYSNRFESNIKNKIGSPSFFLNAQYSYKMPESYFSSGENFIYIQLGTGYHKYGEEHLTQEKNLTIDGKVAETTRTETQYNEGATFIAPEIGFQKLNKRSLWSIGLAGAFNINNNLFVNTYTSSKPDQTPSSDKLIASGSYIGINLKYGFSVMYKGKKGVNPRVKASKPPKIKKEKPKKPVKPEKPKKEKKPKTTKEKPVVKEVEKPAPKATEPTPPETTAPVDTTPKVINGRVYEIDNSISVKSPNIKIIIWDNKRVDGDKISLSFNNEWILEDYTLVRKHKVIDITLVEGSNHLVLYALNLGEYPPNTAALLVNDNETLQEIILESTLENSGALEIIYKP